MSEPAHHDSAPSSSTNFFPNALGTIVNGGAFIGTYVEAPDDRHKHLEPLYIHVSQNAILNQGGRADDVRCHPGTREEVIAKVEAWRDGGYLLDRLIFWLSGPAGAGKSAIVQTVAERWIKDDIAMINFFFFRADGTRNHPGSLVPTLLFQLFDIYPGLKAIVSMIIRENPLVFSASLPNQFRTLILNPILELQQRSSTVRPIFLLIDGLDECEPKAQQSSLLRIIHDLVNDPMSPFVALVASRAEDQIVMSFNSIGSFNGSIVLDSSYRPEKDIRQFVRSELAEVRRTHAHRHTLGVEWPTEDEIDTIVRKSSGQFIYAATTVRAVSDPCKSPKASLRAMLGVQPAGNSAPFAGIDALYTHTLSQVADWDIVRSVIFLDLERDFLLPGIHKDSVEEILDCKFDDITSFFVPLASICSVSFSPSKAAHTVHFHHSSFLDFLRDRTRSGNFHLCKEAIATQILVKLVPRISFTYRIHPLALLSRLFFYVRTPTIELTLSLLQITHAKVRVNVYLEDKYEWYSSDILDNISRIYWRSEPSTEQAIVRSWLPWFQQLGIPRGRIEAWVWHIPNVAESWPAERMHFWQGDEEKDARVGKLPKRTLPSSTWHTTDPCIRLCYETN